MATKVYGLFAKSIGNAEIDFDTDTIKVMLASATYTPDQDTHDYKNDVTNEISGTGYTAGGATLASKTVTYGSGSNTVTWDCADITWGGNVLNARYAIFYKSTGTDSTSPLILYWDFGSNMNIVGLGIDPAGLLTFTTA